MKNTILLLSAAALLWALSSCKKDPVTDPGNEKYFPTVKTIIANNCFSCHNSAGTWEGRPTAFDDDAAIASQFAAIKAAVADPISPTNKRMPQGGSLSQQDIDTIVKWFDKGGKVTD